MERGIRLAGDHQSTPSLSAPLCDLCNSAFRSLRPYFQEDLLERQAEDEDCTLRSIDAGEAATERGGQSAGKRQT